MIRELCAYYDRLAADPAAEVPPFGYSLQKISFIVVLHADGRLHAFQDARQSRDNRWVPQIMKVPGQAKSSGSGLNPGFLWDTSQYLLGFKPDDPKPQRTAEVFAAFRERHLAIEAEIGDPAFSAVCAFLRAWTPAEAAQHAELAEIVGNFGVFKLVGATECVHDRPLVRAYWEKQMSGERNGPVAPSLIDGTPQPIARLHEPKIKGVIGAQTSGAALVSCNQDAFESYGKSQSYNAPLGEGDAFKYCTALDRLTANRRVVLGDTTIVFWADGPTEWESAFSFVLEPPRNSEDPETVSHLRGFFERVRRLAPGSQVEDADVRFYVLGLAPNASRLAVRFWLPGTVGSFAERLKQHFDDLEIGYAPPDAPPLTLRRILNETAREPDEVSPPLGGAVSRAVLAGGPYPVTLLSAVLHRIGADGRLNYARAAILKAFLVRAARLSGQKEDVSMTLDTTNPSIAYRLGRLFAVLEKVQEEAYDNSLNTTIKDRFFSSASANPVAVFPRLLRLHAHHLDKLSHPGRKTNIEKLVQEICSHLPADAGFPAHLPLADQGRFFIGYYHQRQDLFTKKTTPENGGQEEIA